MTGCPTWCENGPVIAGCEEHLADIADLGAIEIGLAQHGDQLPVIRVYVHTLSPALVDLTPSAANDMVLIIRAWRGAPMWPLVSALRKAAATIAGCPR